MLESLDDVTKPLVALGKGIRRSEGTRDARDSQESRALEKNDLLGLDTLRQPLQIPLDNLQVRNQAVHDIAPGLVQALIPDTGRKNLHTFAKSVRTSADMGGALEVEFIAVLGLDEVHFVDESEDGGAGRVLGEGVDDRGVGGEVAVEFARLDVEDVDEDADVGEDVGFLRGEVVGGEGVLAIITAISLILVIRGSGWVGRFDYCVKKKREEEEWMPYPPQSQRFNTRLPRNLTRLCSTSMVAPRRRTSLAT